MVEVDAKASIHTESLEAACIALTARSQAFHTFATYSYGFGAI